MDILSMFNVFNKFRKQTDLRSFSDRTGIAILDYLLKKSILLGISVSTISIFITYLILANLSYAFVIPPNSSSVFWIPSGFTFFIFIRTTHLTKFWPFWLLAIFFGELAVTNFHELPISSMYLWAFANALLPLMAGLLARRLEPGLIDFKHLRDVKYFTLITIISVIPGSLIAAFGNASDLKWDHYLLFASTWAVSDALGILLIAPVLLTWTASNPKTAGHAIEAISLFSTLVVSSVSIGFMSQKMMLNLPLMTFLFFFVAWASIRFGPRSTTLALLIIDVIEVLGIRNKTGPFVFSELTTANLLLSLQIVTANLGLLMLLLAAAIEEQRAARLASEIALQSRDDFLLIASHELKTPITALQMQIELVNRLITQRTFANLDQDKQIKLGKISVSQIKRLNSLIDQLLDVSRISAKTVVISPELFELTGLVRTTINHFEVEIQRAKCQIIFHIAKPVHGRWDRLRIEQVIVNLLMNALKYGEGKPIDITVRTTDGQAELLVKDHGVGISMQDQTRIFKRFERASSIRTYGGLGLGLYVANQIVEAHGGHIRVESKENEGSTFLITLPLNI